MSGASSVINPMMSPTNQTNLDRKSHNLFLGANYLSQKGFLMGHRFAAEIGAPFYQEFGGTQLKTNLIIQLGWQKAY